MTSDDTGHITPSPFRSPTDLGRYVPFLMTRVSSRWAANQNAAFTEIGLNGTMFRVMASLSAFEQLTINQLSTLSATEQSTTSRTVEQLVSSGHVERRTAPTDQRVRTVVLTEDGRALLDRITPAVTDRYTDLLKGIAGDDLETCIQVLRKMADNLGESWL